MLAALHGRGGADHHQPDEQVARHLLEPVDAGEPEEAQHDLHEHGAGHDGQDQPADMAEPIVGARPAGVAPVLRRPAPSLDRWPWAT